MIQAIPFRHEMISRGDDRITPYLSDTLMRGDPDLVYRARDLKDLREILRYCHENRIPVTFCGNRTSLTGASVATEGLLVSVESWDRLLDLRINSKTGRSQAIVQPGILLGDLQRHLAQEGFFYPPDPTSRNEAQLGGTVGTNATGEDSLLYGPTRRYVSGLKLLLADGRELEMIRQQPYRGPTKNRAGYCLERDPIEKFIGSEGTLALITEVTVDLLPAPREHFQAWAFFPDLDSALEFVVAARGREGIQPRSLELMDHLSLTIIARQERAPEIPQRAHCAISFKQEYSNSRDQEILMGRWLDLIREILERKDERDLLDAVVVACDATSQERLRILRHAIPSTINEEASRYVAEGGGKISTDWWVPLPHLRKVMKEVFEESDASGVPYLAFAHIGNGHPHLNYVARNSAEMKKAQEILIRQCRRAAACGGGVAGEHGLGKLHRHLLPLQCSPSEIRKMREIKNTYDPHNILGRGNIFEE